MIREARESDKQDLVRMAKRFHSLTDYAQIVPFDRESFEASVDRFMAASESIIIVAEDDLVYGMAAALVYPQWWNHKHTTGQELFWWIDEDKRGGPAAIKMLVALERWAASKGAKSFSMIHTPNLAPDSLKKFYERRGYRQWDHVFTKEM